MLSIETKYPFLSQAEALAAIERSNEIGLMPYGVIIDGVERFGVAIVLADRRPSFASSPGSKTDGKSAPRQTQGRGKTADRSEDGHDIIPQSGTVPTGAIARCRQTWAERAGWDRDEFIAACVDKGVTLATAKVQWSRLRRG